MKNVGLALVCLAVLALALPAPAGNCYHAYSSSYYPSYYSSYYAPSYYPSYYYPKTVYVAEVIPQPVALFQFVTPQVTTTTVTQQTQTAALGVSSAGVATTQAGAPQTATRQGDCSMLTDAQVERLALIIAKAVSATQQGAAPSRSAEPAPPPKPNPPPAKPESADVAKVKNAYKVAAIAADKCIQCHTKGSEKGKIYLFDEQARFGPNCTPEQMWKAVKDDDMPKGPPEHKLSAAEKEVFKQFAQNQQQ